MTDRPTDQPAPASGPRRWWRRKAVAVPAIAVLAIIGIVIVVVLALGRGPSSPISAPAVITLPFTGLQQPRAVAVDTDGNVYVADYGTGTGNGRVLKLSAGSTTPTNLPVDIPGGRFAPTAMAVDTHGNVYIVDGWVDFTDHSPVGPRVRKLAAGSTTPIDLPFAGLRSPDVAAVDADGNVYLFDSAASGTPHVFELAAGSTTQTDLPFTNLDVVGGMAVDTHGDVYLTDTSTTRPSRVLKLGAGSTTPTEVPVTGLRLPGAVAVDTDGNLYIADAAGTSPATFRVVKLAAGSTTPTGVPLTGLRVPGAMAVDNHGNLYVVDQSLDSRSDRVLKLSAGGS